MSKIKYRDIKMSKANQGRLELINEIIEEYQNDGYVLTLRQLYYQLVSRDIIPNQPKEYSKLSTILKEGRMAGIVDWDAIEDRLRKPSNKSSFSSPEEILSACISQYEKPRMEGQRTYLEVWVEKDALSGVLKRVTEKYHIPIMVNRGYSSASAMFDSYQRFKSAIENGQKTVKILYLGDFDPSGMDMIRDIHDRVFEFLQGDETIEEYDTIEEFCNFSIVPIALTMEQIKKFNPPPNPAKITDPRAKDYIVKYGKTSWEVDALPPKELNNLLESAILEYIDLELYDIICNEESNDIAKLKSLKKYL